MTKTRKCQKCGAEILQPSRNQKYCKPCAKKVAREQWREAGERKKARRAAIKEAGISGSDTPEMIKRCLACKLPKCINCLNRGKGAEE